MTGMTCKVNIICKRDFYLGIKDNCNWIRFGTHVWTIFYVRIIVNEDSCLLLVWLTMFCCFAQI